MLEYLLISQLGQSKSFWDAAAFAIMAIMVTLVFKHVTLDWIQTIVRPETSLCFTFSNHYNYREDLMASVEVAALLCKLEQWGTGRKLVKKRVRVKLAEANDYHSIDVYSIQDRQCGRVSIGHDIYLDLDMAQITPKYDTKEDRKEDPVITYRLKLYSYKRNIRDMMRFVEQAVGELKEKIRIDRQNKMYHVTLRIDGGFVMNVVHDETNGPRMYESFDTLQSEQKYLLMRAIDRLENKELYAKLGARRKLSFLFHGPPGTGKTAHVLAMAKYAKRHIVEIQLGQIDNFDLVQQLVRNPSELIGFRHEDIILVFDEFDQISRCVDFGNTAHAEPAQLVIRVDGPQRDKEPRASHLGQVLSTLDGLGNYDGLIIVAMTNSIELFPPALVRPGRLTPVKFDFCDQRQMEEMIRQADLDPEDTCVRELLNGKTPLSHAQVRHLLDQVATRHLTQDDHLGRIL